MRTGYDSKLLLYVCYQVKGGIAVLACLLIAAGHAHAEDGKKANKIGVVDMKRILDEAQAAKHIQKQVETHRSQLEKEFGNLEQQLKKQKQKLINEQGQLDQQAFREKRVQFQQKLQQTRNEAQTTRQRLKKAIDNAMNVLRKNVKEVSVKLGESRNYDLVISRQGAIYAADKHDMTDAVLNRLNNKITEINIDYNDE